MIVDQWAGTEISDEQEANLRKLAAYLFTLPANYPDFEMSHFTSDGQGSFIHLAHKACGTAACAVGHGPAAGLEPLEHETWGRYSHRLFISDLDSVAWDWCFGGAWSDQDNTVHGAARRILWMLEHGVPDDAEEQHEGVNTLCYLPAPEIQEA